MGHDRVIREIGEPGVFQIVLKENRLSIGRGNPSAIRTVRSHTGSDGKKAFYLVQTEFLDLIIHVMLPGRSGSNHPLRDRESKSGTIMAEREGFVVV